MYRRYLISILLIISITLLTSFQLYAQEEGEIIIISKRVGKEIDQEEREKFKLFQGIDGFRSAVYLRLPDNKLFLEITLLDNKTGKLKIDRLQQSEASIKNRGLYIDRFEEIQASKIDTIQTQNTQNSETDYFLEPSTAFYIELLGKGFYSLNVDFRKNKSEAMALGIQWVENAFITSFMYYRFRGETYRSEIGGGFSGIFSRDDGFAGVMIHVVLGYRYQKKNGLLFRIGFTPFIGIPFTSTGKFVIMPWVGISLGYSL
jgi:hypothetical protein